MNQDDFEEINPRMQSFHFLEEKTLQLPNNPNNPNDQHTDETISIIHHAYNDWLKAQSIVKPQDVQAIKNFLTFLLRSTELQLGSDFKPNDFDKRLLDSIFDPSKNGRASAN